MKIKKNISILWLPFELVIVSLIYIINFLFLKMKKKKIVRLMYFLYVINYYVTFYLLNNYHYNKPKKGKDIFPIVHIKGPYRERKGDKIFIGDLILKKKKKVSIEIISNESFGYQVLNKFDDIIKINHKLKKEEDLYNIQLSLDPVKESKKKKKIKILLKGKTFKRELKFEINSINKLRKINKISIERLKHGAKFAFSWRIDWDHPTSPKNLEFFFNFVEKWKIPPSIFVTGMVLDEELYKKYITKHDEYILNDMRDVLFKYRSMPTLIDMKKAKSILMQKKFKNNQEFPIKCFSAEIGNHMYHHFGGPETDWKKPPSGIFELEKEVVRCDILINKVFRVKPKVWARPAAEVYPDEFGEMLRSRGYIGTTNYRYLTKPWNNPCLKIKKYYGMFEVGSNFPRDPYAEIDIMMFKTIIDYCNQRNPKKDAHIILGSHLGPPFLIYTQNNLELLFKEVIESSSWVCTISSLIEYFKLVKSLKIEYKGNTITIENPTDSNAIAIPLEITYNNRYKDMILFDCQAGDKKYIY